MPYVSTNGIRLAYERAGSGEPVLLIMGQAAARVRSTSPPTAATRCGRSPCHAVSSPSQTISCARRTCARKRPRPSLTATMWRSVRIGISDTWNARTKSTPR